MNSYIAIVIPFIVNELIYIATAVILGSYLDATACTAIAALMVIPAAVYLYRKEKGTEQTKKDLCVTGMKKEIAAACLCAAAGCAVNLLWSNILNLCNITGQYSNSVQESMLSGEIALQIVGLGIIVPVAEELIHRALIYRRMKRIMPVWCAILLSSVLFALVHGNMVQIIFSFPMAVLICLIYERKGHILFPILFHAGANLTAVLISLHS